MAATILPAQISPTHYYGSGIHMDGVGNFKIGGASGTVAIRFRVFDSATQTASLDTVWGYLITSSGAGSGYTGGTGGTVVLEVRTDDGTIDHNPTSTVLYDDAASVCR